MYIIFNKKKSIYVDISHICIHMYIILYLRKIIYLYVILNILNLEIIKNLLFRKDKIFTILEITIHNSILFLLQGINYLYN